MTDVTEFKYGNGQKAYLSAILDLHDKSIVSFVLGHSNNNSLVFQTLELALQATPGSKPMIHSDRGFQYTSWGFKKRLEAHGLTQSMYVSASVLIMGPWKHSGEHSSVKSITYINTEPLRPLRKILKAIFYFYNYERLQAKLNSLSPMEVRTKAA